MFVFIRLLDRQPKQHSQRQNVCKLSNHFVNVIFYWAALLFIPRQDTLRDDCDTSDDCTRNCCVVNNIVAPVYFVVFVLMSQFVLVNVVVAVLMKHLEVEHRFIGDVLEIKDLYRLHST